MSGIHSYKGSLLATFPAFVLFQGLQRRLFPTRPQPWYGCTLVQASSSAEGGNIRPVRRKIGIERLLAVEPYGQLTWSQVCGTGVSPVLKIAPMLEAIRTHVLISAVLGRSIDHRCNPSRKNAAQAEADGPGYDKVPESVPTASMCSMHESIWIGAGRKRHKHCMKLFRRETCRKRDPVLQYILTRTRHCHRFQSRTTEQKKRWIIQADKH